MYKTILLTAFSILLAVGCYAQEFKFSPAKNKALILPANVLYSVHIDSCQVIKHNDSIHSLKLTVTITSKTEKALKFYKPSFACIGDLGWKYVILKNVEECRWDCLGHPYGLEKFKLKGNQSKTVEAYCPLQSMVIEGGTKKYTAGEYDIYIIVSTTDRKDAIRSNYVTFVVN